MFTMIHFWTRKIKRKIYKLFHPEWGEILMLHRVVNEKSLLYDNQLMEITPDFLEKTILEYKEKKYQFVSLDEVYTIVSGKSKPKQKFVCFTFDDGYKDNYDIAYPIFKKHNCPFAIYISTDFPNHKASIWWYVLEEILMANNQIEFYDGTIYECRSYDEKNKAFKQMREKIFNMPSYELRKKTEPMFLMYGVDIQKFVVNNTMSWSDIIDISKDSLCTIASHTVSHIPLDCIEDELTIKNELLKSKQEIETKINQTVAHFAYPYGRYNTISKSYVQNTGYKTAVLANGGKIRSDADLFGLKRMGLFQNR